MAVRAGQQACESLAGPTRVAALEERSVPSTGSRQRRTENVARQGSTLIVDLQGVTRSLRHDGAGIDRMGLT